MDTYKPAEKQDEYIFNKVVMRELLFTVIESFQECQLH